MRRYELRITATPAEVHDAVDALRSDTTTEAQTLLMGAGHGLRAIDGGVTEMLLLVEDDDDGMTAHRLSLALRELGLHVDEPTESLEVAPSLEATTPFEDTPDSAFEALEDAIAAGTPAGAECLPVTAQPVSEDADPV